MDPLCQSEDRRAQYYSALFASVQTPLGLLEAGLDLWVPPAVPPAPVPPALEAAFLEAVARLWTADDRDLALYKEFLDRHKLRDRHYPEFCLRGDPWGAPHPSPASRLREQFEAAAVDTELYDDLLNSLNGIDDKVRTMNRVDAALGRLARACVVGCPPGGAAQQRRTAPFLCAVFRFVDRYMSAIWDAFRGNWPSGRSQRWFNAILGAFFQAAVATPKGQAATSQPPTGQPPTENPPRAEPSSILVSVHVYYSMGRHFGLRPIRPGVVHPDWSHPDRSGPDRRAPEADLYRMHIGYQLFLRELQAVNGISWKCSPQFATGLADLRDRYGSEATADQKRYLREWRELYPSKWTIRLEAKFSNREKAALEKLELALEDQHRFWSGPFWDGRPEAAGPEAAGPEAADPEAEFNILD